MLKVPIQRGRPTDQLCFIALPYGAFLDHALPIQVQRSDERSVLALKAEALACFDV